MKIDDTTHLPVMLYDGDCGFCQFWVEKWEKMTSWQVRYKPYQTTRADFPQLTEKQCREAIHLVMPDGLVFSGAHAVLRALHYGGRYRWLLWCYSRLPFFARIAEWFYRLVSRHRPFLSKFFHAQKCRV